jgi:hypothetical protein
VLIVLLDLKYSVLQYLYSGPAVTQEWDSRLLGISLDLPSTHLDGSKPFTPPTTSKGGQTPFLWQAPNSNAALFTGQKWTELHALVSHLVEYQHQHSSTQQPPPPAAFFTDKLVSRRYPAWLEHALKLSRARGYWTLYPSETTARTLATVHGELYRAPEEYERELVRDDGVQQQHTELPVPLGGGTLFESLPGGGGGLLPFGEMPLLQWDGGVVGLKDLDGAAAAYADEFRRAVGGCEALAVGELLPKASMGDLFCLRDE